MKTERIGFSHWKADDRELAALLWGDPDVIRYLCAGGSFTEEEVIQRLDTEISNFEKYKIQYFPMFELGSGKLIGCCGLRPFGDETEIFEMGFHLRKEFWGKGLGGEASRAVIDYMSSAIKIKELRAGHHPENAASGKLLRKLGFEYIGDGYYPPTGLRHPWYRKNLEVNNLPPYCQ